MTVHIIAAAVGSRSDPLYVLQLQGQYAECCVLINQ